MQCAQVGWSAFPITVTPAPSDDDLAVNGTAEQVAEAIIRSMVQSLLNTGGPLEPMLYFVGVAPAAGPGIAKGERVMVACGLGPAVSDPAVGQLVFNRLAPATLYTFRARWAAIGMEAWSCKLPKGERLDPAVDFATVPGATESLQVFLERRGGLPPVQVTADIARDPNGKPVVSEPVVRGQDGAAVIELHGRMANLLAMADMLHQTPAQA